MDPLAHRHIRDSLARTIGQAPARTGSSLDVPPAELRAAMSPQPERYCSRAVVGLARSAALWGLGLMVLSSVGVVAPVHASEWTSCGSLTAVHHGSGTDYRVRGLATRATACRTARSVVWDFYAQVLGSSGATVAGGFGCAYRGRRITCRSRSGDSYDGNRHIRWRERKDRARRTRRCGSASNRGGTGAAVGLRIAGAGCKRARKVAKRCVNSGRHPGWTVWRTARLLRPWNTAEIRLVRRSVRVTMGFVGGSNACYPDIS
jgi:hypothetical protein